ncbi:hypothetical protein EKD00_09270 [Chlorobium phaeovibrioides]|uniref:hypothetical protein n=1 Tax=Chlorobium phaeovibrioides TaxID=1094 RepID=UPI000FC13AEE|nr:hypothetical protein [Chlorobium phaeovibrioides]RTY33549.1 hypothetical protein EKD00_09270 [Chlorobium phaeovibrioides]
MKIELHKITECGFYERGVSVPLYGQISEWLPAFSRWVHGRASIVGTKLSDEQEVYCAGCVPSASGAGLKLWNGNPSTDSGVAYISMGESPDGMVSASEQELPNNSIAGWPSFFWILPDSDLIVTLQHTGRIRNRSTAMPQFRDYLSAYLKTASPYIEREVQHNGRDVQESLIRGYRPLQGGSVRSDLWEKGGTQVIGVSKSVSSRRGADVAPCSRCAKISSPGLSVVFPIGE